jgi:hypothetical protein
MNLPSVFSGCRDGVGNRSLPAESPSSQLVEGSAANLARIMGGVGGFVFLRD